ncbi:hypothetical protein OAA91_01535, partial [Fibrobacterales bacterium]|nr:hypothetical protein [Fibrobacterales bacterium]
MTIEYKLQEKLKKSEIWVIKHFLISLSCILALFQFVVYFDNKINVVCTLLILTSTVITCLVALNPLRFYRYPLWSMGLLFFNITTSSGALIIKSIELTPVIDKLLVPQKTFSMLSLVSITSLIYFFFKPTSSKKIKNNTVQKKLIQWGLIQWPSNQIFWTLGIIGLISTFVAQVGYVG